MITSGSLSVARIYAGAPVYSFSGTNFSATGSGMDFGFTGPDVSCFPCVSGNVINTNSTFADVTLGVGTVTINGVTFEHLYMTGILMFTGPSIVVPATASSITLTAPFILSGTMEGCLEPHLYCHTIVFSTQVSGSGLATIELYAYPDPWLGRTLFDFRRVTYTFDDTTIPEPMSILMLTSGLAALGAAKLKLRATVLRSHRGLRDSAKIPSVR